MTDEGASVNKHILILVVENKAGVLARVAGLFSARGINIDSFTGAETHDPTTSHMTVVVQTQDALVQQLRKQLEKLVDVIKVRDVSTEEHVERDLLLIKVDAPPSKRAEICDLVNVFRGRVVDVGQRHLMVEVSGPEPKIEAMISLLRPYGIKEAVRTGRIAMRRGI
jgi:acetolactate synthase-1/3 small subunit